MKSPQIKVGPQIKVVKRKPGRGWELIFRHYLPDWSLPMDVIYSNPNNSYRIMRSKLRGLRVWWRKVSV